MILTIDRRTLEDTLEELLDYDPRDATSIVISGNRVTVHTRDLQRLHVLITEGAHVQPV